MSERVVSDEQLAEWEALAQAATDGPWEFWNADDGDEHEISIRAGEAVSSPGAYKSTDLITEDEIGHMWRSETTAGPDVEQRVSDFEFIAAARSAVPALVRALRDARDENERIREAVLAEIGSWTHEVVEDCWYTCPAATGERDGGECCNDATRGGECGCGLEHRRERIRAALAAPTGQEQSR